MTEAERVFRNCGMASTNESSVVSDDRHMRIVSEAQQFGVLGSRTFTANGSLLFIFPDNSGLRASVEQGSWAWKVLADATLPQALNSNNGHAALMATLHNMSVTEDKAAMMQAAKGVLRRYYPNARFDEAALRAIMEESNVPV